MVLDLFSTVVQRWRSGTGLVLDDREEREEEKEVLVLVVVVGRKGGGRRGGGAGWRPYTVRNTPEYFHLQSIRSG